MSIYHFSEQNSWFLSIIGSLVGSVIAGFFAIIIFVQGKRNDKKKNREFEIKKIKEFEALIRHQITSLESSLLKQIRSICLFLKQIKDDIEQDYELNLVIGFYPDEIFFLNHIEFFKTLIYERNGEPDSKGKYFSELKNNILYLIHVKKSIEIWGAEFGNKLHSFEADYKNSIEKIIRVYETLGIQAENSGLKRGQDPFLERWYQIISEWLDIKKYADLHVSFKHVILPLHELCTDKTIVYGDMRIIFISRDVMNAIFAYENYQKIKTDYYNMFLSLARKMYQSNVKIKNSLGNLINNQILK